MAGIILTEYGHKEKEQPVMETLPAPVQVKSQQQIYCKNCYEIIVFSL